MKHAPRLALAAVALLCGVSVASAASTSKSSTTGSASTTMPQPAQDSLKLSSKQQKTAWTDISSQAQKETAPSSFSAKVGAAVPSDLRTSPVPVSTANKVPVLRPYQYAMLNSNKLLIINPTDHKVAEIITQ